MERQLQEVEIAKPYLVEKPWQVADESDPCPEKTLRLRGLEEKVRRQISDQGAGNDPKAQMEEIKLAGERDPEGKHDKKGEEEGCEASPASRRSRGGGTAHFVALIRFVICLISKPQRFDFLPRAAIHLIRNELCSR